MNRISLLLTALVLTPQAAQAEPATEDALATFEQRRHAMAPRGPLLENPWMRQEYGGNLTVTDGKTTRVYDLTTWTITEETKP